MSLGDQQQGPQTGIPAMALAALLIANLCLSLGAWFVRLADTGPVATGFWRMLIAAPLLFGLTRIAGDKWRLPRKELYATVALASLFFAIDLGFWHLGIVKTKLANATMLGNSTSFFLPALTYLVLRQWPGRVQAIALAAAMLGTILLLGRSFELSTGNVTGDLMCLAAGLLYTLYLAVMMRVRAEIAPLPLLSWSTLFSVLPLLAGGWLLGESLWPSDWTPLLVLALVSQVLGQGLLIYAVGRVSPLMIGLMLLTQPIVAAFVGWAEFGEKLAPADWAGAGLICVALVLVQRKP